MTDRINDILRLWDDSLDTEQHQAMQQRATRRTFLGQSLKAVSALHFAPTLAFLSACNERPGKQQQQLLTQEPWTTFSQVQQILFPDDGNGPSAHDIHATAYLYFVLHAPDTEAADRTFILQGIDWLNQLSQSKFKLNFASASPAQQEALITRIAGSHSGERWLSLLLLYIMEALLVDPIYGGNPQGVGWHWLDHAPGFPRPPASRMYTELLKR